MYYRDIALVGIDIGTQSLKAVVTTSRLAILGQHAVAYEVDYPRPGWAQQDPQLWDRAVGPAISVALERAGLTAADIDAACVTGQLDGCVAVDGHGEPLGPCLIWMDRRAADVMPNLPADFRQRTGLVADPGHMAAKIAWLRKHAMGLGRARFHQPVSYLVERMTGRAVLDHGLASTTMLYRLDLCDYDDDLLAAFAIERDALPAIAGAIERAGVVSAAGAELTGLRQGIPVAVGTGDDFATPIGAGIARPGAVACVLGTAEVVGAVSDELIIDSAGLVETHGYATQGYFVENPGWLSGGSVAWLRQILAARDDRELDSWAAAAPAGSGGVTFLPALSGAMAPLWRPQARACFYGLGVGHDRGHMARAVLEGCSYAMRDVIDRLSELSIATDEVVLVGGGSHSQLWAQIRADLLGRPVAVSAIADACPLGAAVLAAVCAGHQPSVVEAVSSLAVERRSVDPIAQNRDAMDDGYARYRELFAALDPIFTRDTDRR